MALGYIHEFELTEFNQYGRTLLWEGNVYNPFYVATKIWENNFHTLLYTGSFLQQHAGQPNWHMNWQINFNFHYMLPGTRNFLSL